MPVRGLSLATYNIHHGAGVDGRLDLARVAGEIERGAADVVGLQEVDRFWGSRSGFADQAACLAERLGMHVRYAANLDLDPREAGAPRRQYGTAVLSKLPILAARNTLLPRPRGGEQRGLLETVLDLRGPRMRFATTHLQHSGAAERLAQSRCISELLAGADEPTVLAGDLNAAPAAAELAPLWPLLTDAWSWRGDGAGCTYPAESPEHRIDYVLVGAGVEVRSVSVGSSPAADHLQVVTDVTVRASTGGRVRPRRGAPDDAHHAS